VALNTPLSGVYGEVHDPPHLNADLYASRAVSLAVFTRRRPLAQSVTQMGKTQLSGKNGMPTAADL